MNKLSKIISESTERVKKFCTMKTYTIKFKKIKLDYKFDPISLGRWREISNDGAFRLFNDFFESDKDIIIKEITLKDSCDMSSIKFKATPTGYKKMFSAFLKDPFCDYFKIESFKYKV